MTTQSQTERLKQAEREIRADQARQQLQAQAEQFLAQHGIKFRVVASERGPGEWNVTFSRKGGGRLKLEFFQDRQPTAEQVLEEMVNAEPKRSEYRDMDLYGEDLLEYKHVAYFFTPTELKEIRHA